MGHRPIQQKHGPLTIKIAIFNLERMAHWNFKFIGNKWKMALTMVCPSTTLIQCNILAVNNNFKKWNRILSKKWTILYKENIYGLNFQEEKSVNFFTTKFFGQNLYALPPPPTHSQILNKWLQVFNIFKLFQICSCLTYSYFLSLTGDPDLKRFQTRFKIWQNQVEHCDGRWWRYICNFGVGDLKRVTTATELFANKFRIEFDAIAFECMEQWYLNRTQTGQHPDFNVSFYKQQKWVKNHYHAVEQW